MDARRQASGTVLPGIAGGQVHDRGPTGGPGADGERAPEGQAHAQALQSRQAVLAGRGDHEGRSALVLPRRRRRRRPAPEGPPVHDEALPRRRLRKVLLPEGRAEAHARLDQEHRDHGLHPGQAARAPQDQRAARERRACAPLDGEHGLHRPEHLVLTGRQARATRLRPLRPRSVRRCRLQGDRPGCAARQAGARHRRPGELPEDERIGRDPCPRADREAAHVRPDQRVRGDHRVGACPRPLRARDDRVDRSGSAAASSSTRTRTARGRRSPRSTRCDPGRGHRSRRRFGGTR